MVKLLQMIMKAISLLSLLKPWVSSKDNETKFIWFISAKQISHAHTHVHMHAQDMTKNCEKNILQGHSNRTQEHAVSVSKHGR